MSTPITARIELCGELVVELDGRRVEHDLPGRQGRLLVAYLATRRGRPVSRDELIAALWPRDLPADPEKSLAVLLSKVRSALPSRLVEAQHSTLSRAASWPDTTRRGCISSAATSRSFGCARSSPRRPPGARSAVRSSPAASARRGS
jgi:hypothetical protein